VTVDGPVAVVTLDRAEVRNALDLRAAQELDEAFTTVEADPLVRVVVLAAEGPAFCAGADLKALAAGEQEAFIADRGWGGVTRRRRIKPLIAAVEGPALAGGLELVLACDLVVATAHATFGAPEVRWGLIAAAGGAIRLPHRIPPNIANELLLTAKPIDAARAHALGLVNRLVEPGQAVAVAVATALEIAANSPLALEATIRVTELTITAGEEPAWRLAIELLERLRATDDCAEGLAAFAERRQPVWSGR
jgi:enoyl-CoA hydratase/carnithine racemase